MTFVHFVVAMTDVLLYWRDYKQNWISQFAGDRVYFRHSNAKLL